MKLFLGLCLVALATGQPARDEFWKGTSLDAIVDQTRLECSRKNDEIACTKLKVANLLDRLFREDNFKVSEGVEITRNSRPLDEARSRGQGNVLEALEGYLTSHDATFELPLGSQVKVSARDIGEDRLSFDLRLGEGQARKSKLKKVIVPILVFVLLKALTLIPLAIGVLGLKAWNALQLSFFSFIVSIGLAIFQLCKKIAADSHAGTLAAHGPWEYQTAQYRGFGGGAGEGGPAQDLAYSAYARA